MMSLIHVNTALQETERGLFTVIQVQRGSAYDIDMI